jgi:hypothetical protein
MGNLLLIIWWTLIGFIVGTFGSIIGGALLQTCGVRFWLTDFMVSPGSFVFGVIAAVVGCLNAIDEVAGFNRWLSQKAGRKP